MAVSVWSSMEAIAALSSQSPSSLVLRWRLGSIWNRALGAKWTTRKLVGGFRHNSRDI